MTGRERHPDSDEPREEIPSQAEHAVRLFDRLRHRSEPGDGDRLFGGDASTPYSNRDDTDVDAVTDAVSMETPSQIGRFEIIRRLGEGGFGVVLLATDPQLNRRVALKLPGPGVLMQPELLRRFLREGEAAASLDHPHVVPVLEAGHVGSMHYIASPYIEGMSLSEWLARRSEPVAPDGAARLVAVLAEAVQHAHSRGVMHRDLKPSNVLLEQVSSDSAESLSADELSAAARLTDFGLAKLIDVERRDGDTTTHAVLGTPAYMAPEQAEGLNKEVGTAADVFALGAMLYELLTGEPPFKRESHVATLKAVCGEEAVPPSKRNPSVPADLEAICMKCLEKPITARYATAATLAEDLRRFLTGREVSARRIGRGERLRRWAIRKPGFALLSGTAVVLALALLIGSTTAAILLDAANKETSEHLARETRAKEDAKEQTKIARRAQYESYVRQSQLSRRSGRPGQKLDTLRSIKRAANLLSEFGTDDEQRKLLRHEFIACLALPDVATGVCWPLSKSGNATSPDELLFAVDGTVSRYAVVLKGGIGVRRMDDNREIVRVPIEPDCKVRRLQFSSDGTRLAIGVFKPGVGRVTRLCDVENGKVTAFANPDIRGFGSEFDLSPDGRTIYVSGVIYRVDDLKQIHRLPAGNRGRFSPDGTRLAVRSRSGIDILRIRDSRVITTIRPRIRGARNWAWGPDGQRIAITGFTRNVEVWNVASRKLEHELRHDVRMLLNVSNLGWHPSGRFIVTVASDEVSRIWDLTNGRIVLRVDGVCNQFSADGSRLGGRGLRFRFVPPTETTMIPFSSEAAPHLVPHPNGRWLIAEDLKQAISIDLMRGTPVARHAMPPEAYKSLRFSSDGRAAYMARRDDVVRMRIEHGEDGVALRYSIGRPEPFIKQRLHFLKVGRSHVSGLLANSPMVRVVDRKTRKTLDVSIKDSDRTPVYYDVSDDSRFLATASWNVATVHIHSLKDGRLLHDVGEFYRERCIAFHPRGILLAVCDRRQLCVFDPATGRRRFRIASRDTSQNGHYAAFSADGRLLAHTIDPFHIQLRDTGTFAKVAEFPVPEQLRIIEVRFTPDGRHLLAVTPRYGGYAIHVWHIENIRRRLRTLNLDWNHPAIPALPQSKSKRLHVKFDQSAVDLTP